MSQRSPASIQQVINHWLAHFNQALANKDGAALAGLFLPDSHWRDIVALTGALGTTSGAEEISDRLVTLGSQAAITALEIDPTRCAPRVVARAGVDVFEAIVRFRTRAGQGAGVVKLDMQDPAKAWTLLTALESLHGHAEKHLLPAKSEDAYARDFHGPNWLEQGRARAQFSDREPTVLVVGAGHAGLTIAARLGQLGVDALVVDTMQRAGDNWRLRYHSLHLHNKTPVNHLPYMPFPDTFPAYLPKDLLANWLETYVDAMEINFWAATRFEGASYDASQQRWQAQVKRADGSVRTLQPAHIVMATSVSGTPNIPPLPGLDRFVGSTVHSSQYANGAQWQGRRVIVIGTGTSGHDIAQDLHAHGALVTMVQRSPTLVVNVDPSAQLYEEIYLGDGPSLPDRDLLSASMPLALIKQAHKRVTDRVRGIDQPLLDGLIKVGFRLDFGEGGTGWPLKYRQRGGGYYFNVGCSDLIVSGAIKLIQADQISEFTASGIGLADGSALDADLIVLATGYKGPDYLVNAFFGEQVAERVGKVWGFADATQEISNMWTPTGQPGLWFTGGAFSQCRVYSKYLALQILACELGDKQLGDKR